jgi:hypothetical protein
MVFSEETTDEVDRYSCMALGPGTGVQRLASGGFHLFCSGIRQGVTEDLIERKMNHPVFSGDSKE